MLPSSQSYPGAPLPPVYGHGQGQYQMQQYLSSQPLHDRPMHPNVELNSPEHFKQQMQAVLTQIAHVQTLGQNALDGIQNAYHTGNSPTQVEAYVDTLKQTVELLMNMLQQTGIGALPLLPMPILSSLTSTDTSHNQPPVPNEQKLLEMTEQSIKLLYLRQTKLQSSANVIAGLIAPAAPGPSAGPSSQPSTSQSQ
ncbi:hypothetical protein AX16_007391 [Volvariella volvacea WC 439]|nr:hypothetical protein AX16_007391 [Volvariella volvacea WC 439]